MGMHTTAPSGVPAEFTEIATICSATDVTIGGQTVLGIEDARALHAGLHVGRDFSNWIKGRITKYGFQAGIDFDCSPDLASKPKRGGYNALTYRVTLDMAKELAMVENNDLGRTVRRYFIWLEKQAHPRSEPAMRARPYDQWSSEERRTNTAIVMMYRRVLNDASAAWMMEREGFPLPPQDLLPNWRQQSEMWPPQPANSVTITVGQVA